jgi:hypothetical protein
MNPIGILKLIHQPAMAKKRKKNAVELNSHEVAAKKKRLKRIRRKQKVNKKRALAKRLKSLSEDPKTIKIASTPTEEKPNKKPKVYHGIKKIGDENGLNTELGSHDSESGFDLIHQ